MFCHEFSFQKYSKQLFIKDPETTAFANYLSICGHDITVIYQQIFWKYGQYFLKKKTDFPMSEIKPRGVFRTQSDI